MGMTRAASIIYHVTQGGPIHVLLVKPSDPNYGGPDFQVPKGVIDPGETSIDTALREAEEEAGLNQGNMVSIFKVHNYDHITLYAIEVVRMEDFNQPDYEVAEARWFMLRDAFKIIRPYQRAWLSKLINHLREMRLYAE